MQQCNNEKSRCREVYTSTLLIIEYFELLESNRKYIISRQLLKSGTSIGANVHEAQNAESKADFIHKIKIATKELEETKYWLTLYEKSKSYPVHISYKKKLVNWV